MRVSIRNNWVSLGGSSTVKDEQENDVLLIKGKVVSISRKKYIQDLNHELLYTVRNKIFSIFTKKAIVYDKVGNQVAFIRRKIFSVHDRYFVNSNLGKIEIQGNILGFDYHIYLNDEEVGHISRNISLRDSFTLDLKDGFDLPFYVALVIAVDNITDSRREDRSN